MDQHRYIFVGGLHRSATTLLGKVLAQHPEISGLAGTGVIEDEGQLLQTVYPTDMAHGGPGRFAFDPGAHLTEASPLATPEHARQVFASWSPFWNLERPVLLEKSPPNVIRSRYLQALFPDSSFIFIVRHPIATSIATYKWSGTGIHSLVHHWLHAHRLLKADLPGLRRSMIITYESLIAHPAETLRAVTAFAGLQPFEYNLTFKVDGNDAYYRRWREEFFTKADRARAVPSLSSFYKRPRFRDRLFPKRAMKTYAFKQMFGDTRQLTHKLHEAQDVVSIYEPEVRGFGYSLLDLTLEPASPVVW